MQYEKKYFKVYGKKCSFLKEPLFSACSNVRFLSCVKERTVL